MTYKDKSLPDAIECIFKLLDKYKVLYWIDAGSLLKGVRDNTIMTSSDIDLAIHSDQINNALSALKEIKLNGYRIQYNGSYPMLEDLITIFLPETVNKINSIDIYIYNRFEGDFIRRSFHKPLIDSKARYIFYSSKKIMSFGCLNNKPNSNFFIAIGRMLFYLYEQVGITQWYMVPCKYFSNFTILNVHGRDFKVPLLCKEYLQFRYGSDWKTPIAREKWYPMWTKYENKMLINKKLSTLTSIKKYWIGMDL